MASGNPLPAGLADVVVEVLTGRTRHSLMPNVAEPEAIRLHGVVRSGVMAGLPGSLWWCQNNRDALWSTGVSSSSRNALRSRPPA